MGEQQELGGISTADLKRELARREGAAVKAAGRREEILKELADVDRELRTLEGGRNGHKPVASAGVKPLELAPRPRSDGNETRKRNAGLTVREAMRSATNVGDRYAPTALAKKVVESGYVTTARHFGVSISVELTKDTEHWKKVMRGLYERIK